MAVLELLARTAGAGIVTARQLVLHNRRAGLLGTGVLLGSGTLVFVGQLGFLQILLRFSVLLLWCGMFGSCILYLLYDMNLCAG